MKHKLILLSLALLIFASREMMGEAYQAKPVKNGVAARGGLSRNAVFPCVGVAEHPKLKWRFETGGFVKASPVLWNNTIYVGSLGGKFHAIDAEKGMEKWSVAVKGGVVSSACIADDVVYFGGMDGNLYAVEAESGKVKWQVRAAQHGASIRSSPAVAYGAVFIFADALSVHAVDDGRFLYGGAVMANASPITFMVAMTDKYLFGATGTVDIQTGYWAGSFHDATCTTTILDGEYCYNAVTAYNNRGAPNYPSILRSKIARVTNATYWQTDYCKPAEPHKAQDARFGVYGGAVVFNGVVALGCDSGHVYAYDAANGQPKWNCPTGGPVRNGPVVSAKDGLMYFSSRDGSLYAVDAMTGAKKWSLVIDKNRAAKQTNEKADEWVFDSSAWVSNGCIYIGTDDGGVYAVSQ